MASRKTVTFKTKGGRVSFITKKKIDLRPPSGYKRATREKVSKSKTRYTFKK